jgi:hypothetical protein
LEKCCCVGLSLENSNKFPLGAPSTLFKETLGMLDFLSDFIKISGLTGFSVFNRLLWVFGYN